MVFVNVRFNERKGGKPSKTKLLVDEYELLPNVMRQALGRFINNERLINNNSDDDVESAYKCIKVVSCNGNDLTKSVNNPDATLSAMNSYDTQMFKRGLDILLSPVEINTGEGEAFPKQ